MDVKTKAKTAYNSAADSWHKSRITTLENFEDVRLLKQNRPHLFIEKPAMQKIIPDLKGKSVLCLGCGSGEEVEFLLTKNPDKITGVDISEKLIEIAKNTYPSVEFKQMDAENLLFEKNSFDFVYCSLMMDYFENWEKVLKEVYKVLNDKGIFLFSNLHPVKWGAKKINDADGKSIGALMGFQNNPDTGKLEIYGNYLDTTEHEEIWMNKLIISFYTKPISIMYKELIKAGFIVKDMVEPKAIKETKKYDEAYWKINQFIPNFIIFECLKK